MFSPVVANGEGLTGGRVELGDLPQHAAGIARQQCADIGEVPDLLDVAGDEVPEHTGQSRGVLDHVHVLLDLGSVLLELNADRVDLLGVLHHLLPDGRAVRAHHHEGGSGGGAQSGGGHGGAEQKGASRAAGHGPPPCGRASASPSRRRAAGPAGAPAGHRPRTSPRRWRASAARGPGRSGGILPAT
jgi:hypothetical protein